MSVAKRRKPDLCSEKRSVTATPLSTKGLKLECDHLREKLQKSIIDNPQMARKAALLVGLWIEGKEKKRKKEAA